MAGLFLSFRDFVRRHANNASACLTWASAQPLTGPYVPRTSFTRSSILSVHVAHVLDPVGGDTHPVIGGQPCLKHIAHMPVVAITPVIPPRGYSLALCRGHTVDIALAGFIQRHMYQYQNIRPGQTVKYLPEGAKCPARGGDISGAVQIALVHEADDFSASRSSSSCRPLIQT